MKKKLLIILGAGSSVQRGIPSVGDLDTQMKMWANAWATEHGLQNYFGLLWDEVSSYYSVGDRRRRPDPNFEKILGEMVALSHWMTPAPWGDTLRQTACAGTPPPGVQFPVHPFVESAPYAATITVDDQRNRLLGTLARHMRAASLAMDSQDDAARGYQQLVDCLRKEFDVGIYNLNYDTAALDAWPEAYTGFSDSGLFEPAEVHRRQAWDFIYHLHGSVHHSLSTEHGGDIRWRNDLKDAANFFDNPATSANDKRSEEKSFSRATLIAGGFKLDQLLVEPFHSFHASLVRHIYAADAFLIGGYGFTDVHINRALQNRWGSLPGKPPIMVLDYAREDTDPMTFREDPWAYELSSALGAVRDFFREIGHPSPPRPSELAKQKAFEVEAHHRVAIWYGGFTSAATAMDRIVPWLSGGPDTDLVSQQAS
jgi:hypothetical protein